MNNLKPCPFCGGTNLNIEGKDIWGPNDLPYNPKHIFRIKCSALEGGCGATNGYYRTEEGAIEAWNRRDNNG